MTEKEKFEYIINLKKSTQKDVKLMEELIRTHIDTHSYQLCNRCPSKIRYAHQRIVRWYNNNKNNFK